MTEFKIKTLNWNDFNAACNDLRSLVDKSGFHPDAVIAIPRGGCYLQNAAWSDCRRLVMSLPGHKPATLKKYAAFFLRRLPLAVRDRIRIWDARRLVGRANHMDSTAISLPEIDSTIKTILLLDDAVDSGATLSAISTCIKKSHPDIDIKSAVITVTSSQPLCIPDFYLYNNSTLVRMPWSIDA